MNSKEIQELIGKLKEDFRDLVEIWNEQHTIPHNELLYCPFCGQTYVFNSSFIEEVDKNNNTDRICSVCGDVFLRYITLMPGYFRFSSDEHGPIKNN